MALRKKLIEVSLPLEAINAASAKEKSIRHGHPSTLHLWWARRPLAACRAVLFAQLVDDPSSWPDRFPTEAEQEAERKRLHDLIARMVPWEATNNETILNEARFEIARSIARDRGEEPPAANDPAAVFEYLQTKAPAVYDPFCGGGSIPLEAQRLGLRAYGSDLNPVAVLVSKAFVEIPPKFAGLPPVNPESCAKLARGGSWSGRGAEGLAEDVRYYGRGIREQAEKRIGHLYPKAKLRDGSEAIVIAWLWTRTVRSPDPAAKGAMVPLISSFMLATKEGRKAWVAPVIDSAAPDGYRFEVRMGALSKADEERFKDGTKTSRGNFQCLLTGAAISDDWNRAEGKAGRLRERLVAIAVEREGVRSFINATEADEMIARSVNPDWEPEGELYPKSIGARVPAYGLTKWRDQFTRRQLVTLTTFSGLAMAARETVLEDARSSCSSQDTKRLHEGGLGAEAYADAVATYLGLAASKLSMFATTQARWRSGETKTAPGYGRQAISMVWDYAEINPFAGAGGDWMELINGGSRAFAAHSGHGRHNRIENLDARMQAEREVIISTDPPYYDNVGYADLSDHFYVWLRPTLQGIWPNLFRRMLTPKDEELVATAARHGGRSQAERFFMEGISAALRAMTKATVNAAPLTIYYAFKQSELVDGGVSSAGWAAFLQGVVAADLCVDGTWPMRTENATRMRGQLSNALASSIVLTCRKRAADAGVITRSDFIRVLRRELPSALEKIREAGIQAVDFQQAAIGPAMGVFSRFTKVMEADDSAMTVHTALTLINALIEELASEQDATYDADTQAALVWFQNYGWTEQPSGQAIVLATSKNTTLAALFNSHIFTDLRGMVRLTKRVELSLHGQPGSDRRFTLWEAAQYLARALDAEDGGIDAAAHFFAGLGPRSADVLPLVERLYRIAGEQRKDAVEALVWNRLHTEWPTIERRADELAETLAPTLFDRGAAQ